MVSTGKTPISGSVCMADSSGSSTGLRVNHTSSRWQVLRVQIHCHWQCPSHASVRASRRYRYRLGVRANANLKTPVRVRACPAAAGRSCTINTTGSTPCPCPRRPQVRFAPSDWRCRCQCRGRLFDRYVENDGTQHDARCVHEHCAVDTTVHAVVRVIVQVIVLVLVPV